MTRRPATGDPNKPPRGNVDTVQGHRSSTAFVSMNVVSLEVGFGIKCEALEMWPHLQPRALGNSRERMR